MRWVATIAGVLGALLLAVAAPSAQAASFAPGRLYGFGANADGQLGSPVGNESQAPNPVPAAIALPGAAGPVVEEAAGEGFALALTGANQLFSFGSNRFGQLGVAAGSGASGANPVPREVSLPGAGAGVTQLAAGAEHAIALTATGGLYSFGSNRFGQLGRAANSGSETPNPAPERIALPGADGPAVQVAAGAEESLVLTSTGQLYSFGGNRFGQLGRAASSGSETPNPIPAPVALPGASGPVVQIAAGAQHSLALTSTGQLFSFGANRFGQLGRGAGIEATGPNPEPAQVAVPGLSGRIVAIAAGGYHSLALSSSGQIFAFGRNDEGQLGSTANNGSERANPVPTAVVLPGASARPVALAAGALHSLVVTATGALYAFGSNAEGQLGRQANSGSDAANPAPQAVALPSGETIDAAARGSSAAFTLAQTADLAVLNATLPAGQVGVPYAAEASSAGGVGGNAWSAAGLPPGLSLDPLSGRIAGTPVLAGTSEVVLSVTDAFGVSAASPTLLLTIAPAIAPRAFLSTALTEAQIRASLRQQLGMKGRAARISSLRRRGRFPYAFTALTAGALSIGWYHLPPGSHLAQQAAPLLVAAGGTSFRAAGTKTIVLRVTKAGRRLLRRRKRIALVAKGTFTPSGRGPISATKGFYLAR